MQAILSITAPFFALILCGYLAAQRGVLPVSAIGGLNAFVLYFALPCMLLRFGMNTPVAALFDPVIMGLYFVCAMVVVSLGLLLGWRMGARSLDSAFTSLVAAFPNSGFIGVPLLVALAGPGVAGPVICTLLVDIFITTSACLALAQRARERASAQATGEASSLLQQLWASLVAPLRNPLPWSVAAGALMSALDARLTGPVDSIVRMLADSASPVALFTIGAVLYRTHQSACGTAAPGMVRGVVVLKLLVHPLLVLSAALAARSAGAPLSDLQVMALTLVSALPSASNVTMLAERYRADDGLVARIILWSTVLAFATFSLWAWAFGVQGSR
jgi:malonate transporter